MAWTARRDTPLATMTVAAEQWAEEERKALARASLAAQDARPRLACFERDARTLDTLSGLWLVRKRRRAHRQLAQLSCLLECVGIGEQPGLFIVPA